MAVGSEVIPGYKPQVDPSEHSAAYKIWHYRFLCQMAQMHLYSREYIAQGGIGTSGDSKVDRSLAEGQVTVQLTPAAMAIFHDEGVPFRLVNPKDAAAIYSMIFQHQQDWRREASLNLNMLEAPIDDLRKLDALAGAVYPFARPYLVEQNPFHGTLMGLLENIRMRRGGYKRRLNAQQEQPANPVDNLPKTHTPMADAINETVSNRRKAWQ